LLLWKPTWEVAEPPFITRAWDIFNPNAQTGRGEPEPIYPVRQGALFVLDGQQRLTSLFRVIFRSRLQGKDALDPDLLVSLSQDPEWEENPFRLKSRQLRSRERDGLLVRAEVLFAGVRGEKKSEAIKAAIQQWVKPDDERFFTALDRANFIRNAILTAEIIAYEIDASAESDSVIEIFVRLNQQGVRLRPSDLAAARLTGKMTGFRTRAREVLDRPEFTNFARQGAEEEPRRAPLDTDLLVRTALFLGTGLIRYRDIEERKAGSGDDAYPKVETEWDRAVAGLKRAVDILRDGGIPDGMWLPYRYLLLPPAVSIGHEHDLGADFWLGWTIAASLWGHYAAGADTRAQNDAKLAKEGVKDKLFDSLKSKAKRTSLIPDKEDFTESIVQESGVFLALLVHFQRNEGRSFPSGKRFSAATESVEVHHIFARKLLSKAPHDSTTTTPDRLGNLALLYLSDNRSIGDDPPGHYLPKCRESDLELHGIPLDRGLWETAAYSDFCTAREERLFQIVSDLLLSLGVR
jgi:hypothetical protein